jgi:hypothetical protein
VRPIAVFGAVAVWLAFATCPRLALAADPVRGYELFTSDEQMGPCVLCHGNPKDNRFRVLKGANNPEVIRAEAARQRVPPVPQQKLEDVAAYLATYLSGPVVTAPADPMMVVEYFHASFDHYFITILPAEIAALDTGTQTGWKRTGRHFYAWKSAADAPSSATPVCRFYIPPAQGDSHFYSASPAECAVVDAQFPLFDYESSEVMYVLLPDAATGACSGVTAPVFRLWNDPASRKRTDNNHRFTTDTTTRETMVMAGSRPEGYGEKGVGMCAPLPPIRP